MSGMRLRGCSAAFAGGLLCMMAASAPAFDDESTTDEPAPKSSPPQKQLTLDQLSDALASPDYEERQQATEFLKAKKKPFTDELTRLYRLEHDHEIRLRLVEVAEYIFLKQAQPEMGGFMGIQLDAVDGNTIPRLGEGRVAVMVNNVLPDTAAERAKLKTGDLILTVDGEEVPVSSATTRRLNIRPFIELIGSKPPGTELEFQVLRANELFISRIVLGVKPLTGLNRVYLFPEQREAVQKAGAEFARWRAELENAP